MSYHAFKCDDGTEFGSFEVFYADAGGVSLLSFDSPQARATVGPGWYWWPCFPGCLPDGEASGPFATEQEAIDDAREE